MWLRPRNFYWIALVLWLTLGCGGGGGPTGMISGEVTKGGQPLADVSVAFLGTQATAAGVTDAAGKFEIRSPTPTGTYRVAVKKRLAEVADPEFADNAENAAAAASLVLQEDNTVPAKYRSTSTSGLQYEITSGENVIQIALD